jgi:hypothetical protein
MGERKNTIQILCTCLPLQLVDQIQGKRHKQQFLQDFYVSK